MATFGRQLFILLAVFICDSSCVIRATYETGKGIRKLHSLIDNMTLHMEDFSGANELLNNARENQDIKNELNHINNQLNHMGASMDPKIISGSLKLTPSEILLYKSMDEFDVYIQAIDEEYRVFNKFMENRNNNANDEWKNSPQFVQDLESIIGMIRNLICKEKPCIEEPERLPLAITHRAQRLSKQSCDDDQITSSLLVKFFMIAMIAEIKVNVMLTFANVHRYATNREWTNMNILDMEKFGKQSKNYVSAFEEYLALTDSLYLRACDPKDGLWKRNESFHEIEETFQTTLFRYHWAACKYSGCQRIQSSMREACKVDIYDSRSSCSGTVDDCFYLKSVKACVLVPSAEISHGYDGNDGYMIEDGSGLLFSYGTCACNCYRDVNKISLLIMESDVKSNRVITGLRFWRRGTILWIQPRTGKLNAHGFIDQSTETWMHMPITIRKSQTHLINKDNRIFFLDDIRLPLNYVLTGVKFNKVTRGDVTGFAIEIFGVPFHSESGGLFHEDRISRQASNETSGKGLSFQPVSSIYTTSVHTVSPEEMKYVSLTQSTLKSDFGQSTLPLFDAVPVQIDSPSALGGIGIFHKGVEGYAGFLSLRVYGIEYAAHFRNVKFLMGKAENPFGQ